MGFWAVHEDGGLVALCSAFEVQVVEDVVGGVRVLVEEVAEEAFTVGNDFIDFDGG